MDFIKLEDWEGWYYYLSEYGIHVAMWVFLSAVTIYRREMSVNRLYHTRDEDDAQTVLEDAAKDGINDGSTPTWTLDVSPSSASTTLAEIQKILVWQDEVKEIETEELLEGAGMYCSALKPMLNLAEIASLWMHSFPGDDEEPCFRMMKADMTPTDLLERAGNYASGEPLAAAIALLNLTNSKRTQNVLPLSTATGSDPFKKELPPDVHVHIVSFLHPRDVVKLPCVSKKYRNLVDDSRNLSCSRMWKCLWRRDYAWLVEEWNIGKQAMARSNGAKWSYNKKFYFRFSEAYLNYVLAGMNTSENCLVGIHGNIYDITLFLNNHPGSPETLMVHSGRDATAFFEDMGHSNGARRLAMSLCVVIDKGSESRDGFGLFPTTRTIVSNENAIPKRLPDGSDNLLQLGRRQARTNRTGSLYHLRREFLAEKHRITTRVTQRFANDPTIMGHEVNPYFDPFSGQWYVWYTETNNMKTVFVPA